MRVVLVSGYFNPLHTGHLDYIEGAKSLGELLVVIVNNDEQVKVKGATEFIKQADRLRIVGAIKHVDSAIISIDSDSTICETIKELWSKYSTDPFFEGMIFCNGGDRKEENTPETSICKELGIRCVYNVGGEKTESSSSLLNKIKTSKIRGL